MPRGAKPKDHTGVQFHKLTALSRVGSHSTSRGAIWLCVCECGGFRRVRALKLLDGRAKSCGKCSRKDPNSKRSLEAARSAARKANRIGLNGAPYSRHARAPERLEDLVTL